MYRYYRHIHSPEVTRQARTANEESELTHTIGSFFLAMGSGGLAETPKAHYEQVDTTYVPKLPSAVGYTALTHEVEYDAAPHTAQAIQELQDNLDLVRV